MNKTTDYSIFGEIESNREVDLRHVRKLMKAIIFLLSLCAVFVSCRKQPTHEEARELAITYISGAKVTGGVIVENVEPKCDPVYTYRFSFRGSKNGEPVTGCVCWTAPDWIVIDVEIENPELVKGEGANNE